MITQTTMEKCICPQESDESEGEALRLTLFRLSTVHDKMEEAIMDGFLTFKEPLFQSVGNDFLTVVKQSYGQKIGFIKWYKCTLC